MLSFVGLGYIGNRRYNTTNRNLVAATTISDAQGVIDKETIKVNEN